MKPSEKIEKLIKDVNIKTNTQTDKAVLDDILNTFEKSAGQSPKIWRIIMKSRMTKLTAAAVIIMTVVVGIQQYGISTAWGQLVERIEQSHEEYMKELVSATEEKDGEKIEFYADLLSEFWQKLGWLARGELDTEYKMRMSALIEEEKANYDDREESDQISIQIFLENADRFSDWLGNIEDVAWINETVHVCKQLEEYAEEIRDAGRHPELDVSYAEHCLPSFVTYCQWFEQLPWYNSKQDMLPVSLLTGIERDLRIARREMESQKIRDVIRFVKRCVQQAQKNGLNLDKKTAPDRTRAQRDVCRKLNRRIDELYALITYAEIASQDYLEKMIKQNQYKPGQRHDHVLTEEFGSRGSFSDYYIERIDQSLGLCEEILTEFQPQR
ncbi:MAG: hypothetical protein ACYSWP_04205 [Planctomycetota bacterium]|jgi:hypothetical protein